MFRVETLKAFLLASTRIEHYPLDIMLASPSCHLKHECLRICTQAILSLLQLKPTLVRGNASEIMALAGASGSGKGVDSTAQTDEALEMGKSLAASFDTIVAITGALDLVRALLLCSHI